MKDNFFLVSGATGFIGSHLTQELMKEGEVLALVRNKNKISNELKSQLRVFEGDLTKESSIQQLYSLPDLSFIFHLGGICSPKSCEEDPRTAIDTNLGGTKAMIDLAKHYNANFVYPSSYYVYGYSSAAGLREEDTCRPYSVLGYTKCLAESMIQHAARSNELSATILRLFIVYGPGSSPSQFCSQVMHKVSTEDQLIFGDLSSVRDFVYVSDVVNALIKASEQQGYNIYNIGSGEPTVVRDVVEEVCYLANRPFKLEEKVMEGHPDTKISDKGMMYADISKAQKELMWSPTINLKNGLKLTYDSLKKD
jgi:nucleoside-diphosphate-sugar epimerase